MSATSMGDSRGSRQRSCEVLGLSLCSLLSNKINRIDAAVNSAELSYASRHVVQDILTYRLIKTKRFHRHINNVMYYVPMKAFGLKLYVY